MSEFFGPVNSDGSLLGTVAFSGGDVLVWSDLATCPGSGSKTLLSIGAYCRLDTGSGTGRCRLGIYNSSGSLVAESSGVLNAPDPAAWLSATSFTFHIGSALTGGTQYRIAALLDNDSGNNVGRAYYDVVSSGGDYNDAGTTYIGSGLPGTLPSGLGGPIGIVVRAEVDSAPVDPPEITDITPNNGDANDTTPIVITGTGFSVAFGMGDAALACSDPEVSFDNVVINSDTEIEADLVATAGATPGVCTITVETDDGESDPFNFTINSASGAPTVSSITPDSVTRHEGESGFIFIDCALVGTDLDGGSPTFNLPAGWDFSGFSAAGGGLSADVTLEIPIDETADDYDLTFETEDGVSNTFTFTVSEPAVTAGARTVFSRPIFGE